MPRRAPRGRTPRLGRPTVLTDDSRDRFLKAVRAGAPFNLACAHAGFSYTSFARWMQHGSEAATACEDGKPYPRGHEPYREFWEEVQRARGAGAMTDLLLVQKAAAGGYVLKETTRRFRGPTGWETETERTYAAPDWRAAGWVLERTYGPEFRRLTQVELSGPHGGPVQVAATDVDDLAARVLLNIEAHRGELPGPDEPVDAEVVDDDRARAS